MRTSVRKIFGLLLASSMLLAACGGAGTGQPSSGGDTPSQETRVISTVMGDVTIPVNPQRVVVLDSGELDSAIALGVKPVGAVTVFADGDFQEYLRDKTDGIVKLGTNSQPNFELIASLEPDLILSSKLRHNDIYETLSQIAPTVFTESVGVSWKENLMVHADALGKTAEAEKLMNDYYTRLDTFKEKMGPELANTQVSVLRGLADHVRMYARANFIGTVLEDAGFARTPSQDVDEFMVRASEERFMDMDGDIILISHFRPANSGETMVEQYMKNPLWQELNAVKNGQVYEIDDDYWMIGIGIGAATRVVDDLYEMFINK